MCLQDPGTTITSVLWLTVSHDTLYFLCASPSFASGALVLCSYNGSNINAHELRPGIYGSFGSTAERFLFGTSSTLFFGADMDGSGRELWTTTDGVSFTEIDINPGVAGSDPDWQGMAEFAGSLYFEATRADVGSELFRYSDGNVTLAGNLQSGTAGSLIRGLTVIGNTLYLRAHPRLWKIVDGVSVNGACARACVVCLACVCRVCLGRLTTECAHEAWTGSCVPVLTCPSGLYDQNFVCVGENWLQQT